MIEVRKCNLLAEPINFLYKTEFCYQGRGVLIQLRVISGTSRPWIRLRKNLKSKSVMGQDRPKDNGLGDRQRKETRGNSKGRGQTHNRKYLFHSCLNSDSLNLR